MHNRAYRPPVRRAPRGATLAIVIVLAAGGLATSPAVFAEEGAQTRNNGGTSGSPALTDTLRSTGEFTLGLPSGQQDPLYPEEFDSQPGQSSASGTLYRDRDGYGTRRYGTATPSGG